MSDKQPIIMNMPGNLVFTKDGKWLHDGVEVTHKGVYLYFSKHIRHDSTLNKYLVQVDGKAVEVEVEDTAKVVKTIIKDSNNFLIYLNDDTQERLDSSTLAVSNEDIWYCRVGNNKEWARLLRPAVQALLPLVKEENGEYFILDCKVQRK